MYYSRRKHKLHKKRQATITCPFCDPSEINYRSLQETAYAYVIPNQTPYDVWENHKVIDHLMIIPKRHVENLGELTDAEALEISRLFGQYEAQGYNVYARAQNNIRRSVKHQHTHLIKISPRQPRFALFLSKPYFRINF